MIEIRRVDQDDWPIVRDVRLAALKDTPDWFWVTYEEEVHQPEKWWRDFLTAAAWFVAYEADRPVGIAAGIRSSRLDESERALISMWVRPDARRQGIGRQLVESTKEWARADGALSLQLEVTHTNLGATRLYERCGFKATGRTEPLPRDPSLIEHEMRLLL